MSCSYLKIFVLMTILTTFKGRTQNSLNCSDSAARQRSGNRV